jgi:hypothetical protein
MTRAPAPTRPTVLPRPWRIRRLLPAGVTPPA